MPNGNVYMDLFDAINRQKKFNDDVLKKSFADFKYKDLKLYLKDMVTDAMVLYYKNSHPHIQLFNQLQKIHFLLVKGLSKEAAKAVEKALKLSTQMELFTVTGYLLRMQLDLSMAALYEIEDINKTSDLYKQQTEVTIAAEQNLIANELLNLSWYLSAKSHQTTSPSQNRQKERAKLNSVPATSQRAQFKKLNTLNYLFNIEGDLQARYETTKKVAALSREIRKFHDSSFNITGLYVTILLAV